MSPANLPPSQDPLTMRFRDITAEQLTPGTIIIDHLGEQPPVTVLRWAEWDQDRFGRWMMRFWARRNDTGAEGYMTYGPGGFVRVRAANPEAITV